MSEASIPERMLADLPAAIETLRNMRIDGQHAIQTVLNGLDYYKSMAMSHEGELLAAQRLCPSAPRPRARRWRRS
jgi:hypothetical protein